jgi:hypothetical protein
MPVLNQVYQRIELLLSAVVGAILFWIILLIPFDIYEFLNNPGAYEKIYRLNARQTDWQWNYLLKDILIFWLAIIGTTLMIIAFRKAADPRWRIVRTVLTLFIISVIGIGYYQWYLTGFDH